MYKKICIIFLIIIILVGCNKQNTGNHKIVAIKDKNLEIRSFEISDKATYYNYIVDDVIVQLFAVKASDGKVKVMFNTCNACNPSETSYFIQKEEYFECQTCKNKFHVDDIGLEEISGCSAITITDENKKIDNDTIIIDKEFIETYKDKFESIKIFSNEKE